MKVRSRGLALQILQPFPVTLRIQSVLLPKTPLAPETLDPAS